MRQQNLGKTQTVLKKQDIEDNSQVNSESENQEEFIRTRINADNLIKCKLVFYAILALVYLLLVCLLAFLVLPESLKTINPMYQLKDSNLFTCDKYLRLQNQTVICNEDNGTSVTQPALDNEDDAFIGIALGDNSTNTSANNLQAITFGNYVQNLHSLNQFVIFYFQMNSNVKKSIQNMNTSVDMLFRVYHAQKLQRHIYIYKQIQKQETYNLNKDSFAKGENSLYLGYVSGLSAQDQYYWQVTVNNQTVFANNTQFLLRSVVIKREFSLLSILVRVVLFFISLASAFKFSWTLKKVPQAKQSIEQRAIQILSYFTLAFNNILYFLTILYPNGFTAFLNTFYIWNYVFVLFVIWVLFLNRIIQEQPENITYQFTRFKIFLLAVYYVAIFTFLLVLALNKDLYYPIRQSKDKTSPGVIASGFIAGFAEIAGICYMIYLYALICRKREDLMWRQQIFIVNSIIFFILTSVFFFIGSYNIYLISASKIIFTYCTLTFFSIFLQYIYTPTQEQLEDFQRQPKQKKDITKEYLLNDNNMNDQAVIQIQDGSYFQEVETLTQKNEPKDMKEKSIRKRKRLNSKKQAKDSSSQKYDEYLVESQYDPNEIVINNSESGQNMDFKG